MAATDKHGIDLAFVWWARYSTPRCVQLPEGRVVIFGYIWHHPGGANKLSAAEKYLGRRFDRQLLYQRRLPLVGEAQAALYELLLAGKIDPNIMSLKFDDYMDGITMLKRKIVGKSVLLMA